MNAKALIARRDELAAELEQIEARLHHEASEPFGVVAIADAFGIDLHEKSIPWSEVPAFIAWLQSLVSEGEPAKPRLTWAMIDSSTAGLWATVDGRPVKQGEVQAHGDKPVTPKPWPIWFANAHGKVTRLVGVIQTSSLVFAAPNRACARDFWIHGDLESYPAFAARWRQNDEEVTP